MSLLSPIDPDHAGDTISLKDIQAACAAQRRAVRSHINDRIATVVAYLPELTAPSAGRPADQPARPRRRLRIYYEDP